MNFTLVLGVAVVLLALSILGIAVKMLFNKGDFKKQCSSANPQTGERIGCSCGGESSCRNNNE